MLKTTARVTSITASAALLVTALVRPACADELRIGLIAPLTGVLAEAGKDMVNGFQMYLDQHKDSLGGLSVTFIVEDDRSAPDVALAKAKTLVRDDKVRIFIGGLSTGSGVALASLSSAEKTVSIASTPGADDLTQRRLGEFPYFIRTGWSASQASHPLGQWACDQGYRSIAIIAVDSAAGYAQAGGFQKAFEACGGRIIQKIWLPLAAKDFAATIARIKPDADALFSVMLGSMAVRFPKQLRASGFAKPILGGGMTYDAYALPRIGDVAIGDVSAQPYSAALDTRKNRSFVVAYREKYDRVPSAVAESSYTTAQMIDDVIKQAKGKWPGPEKFIAMMTSLKIDAVRGPLAFDDMRNPVQNVYIKKVERKPMFGDRDSALWNSVIMTYPAVSQFWRDGKDVVLKQPAYSRDHPPCRYCE